MVPKRKVSKKHCSEAGIYFWKNWSVGILLKYFKDFELNLRYLSDIICGHFDGSNQTVANKRKKFVKRLSKSLCLFLWKLKCWKPPEIFQGFSNKKKKYSTGFCYNHNKFYLD